MQRSTRHGANECGGYVPRGNGWSGEVEVVFQSIESLHRALPDHGGDWYYSGNYPTPGGYRVVNQAFVNYFEKAAGRAY